MKRVIAVFVLLLMLSCQQSTEELDQSPLVTPPLAEDKCVALFIDIHLAEAAMKNRQYVKDSLLLVDIDQLYSRVFQMHDISEDEFQELMDFFTQHPREFEQLYNKVISRLENDMK